MRRLMAAVAFTLEAASLGTAAAKEVPESTFVGWYVRVDSDNWGNYMNFLEKVHKVELEALKKAGHIKGYQFLKTRPKGPDDWNFAIVLEYKNWASLDIPDEVLDDVEDKAVAGIPNVKEMKKAKNAWRRVIGYQIYQSVDFMR